MSSGHPRRRARPAWPGRRDRARAEFRACPRALFEPLVRAAPPAKRRRWLSGAAAAAAAVLGDARAGEADAASVSYMGWTGCSPASRRNGPSCSSPTTCNCASPPCVWLLYLARRIDGLPVALLGATRPADPDDPAPVEQLVAADGTRVRCPGPLGVAASGELIARRLGSPPDAAFTAACHAASGGNPLLLQAGARGRRRARPRTRCRRAHPT